MSMEKQSEVFFDMEFSFSSWWIALPNLVPHHTISYIQLP